MDEPESVETVVEERPTVLVLPLDLWLACVQFIQANPGPIASVLLGALHPYVAPFTVPNGDGQ